MKIDGWKYYNHAAVPTTAPHENVNIEAVQNGTVWQLDGKPLFARWTSEWDRKEPSDWWYIICESPYVQDELSKNARKHVRKALENCEVKKIDPIEQAEDLWRVFQEATSRYSHYKLSTNYDKFLAGIKRTPSNVEYWAGFDRESGRLIGYKICTVYEDWVDFSVSKYSPEFMKLRVSDALYNETLEYYLNEQGKKFVSSGSRTVLHDTKVQEYCQEHFLFRKAYCRLNIAYRKGFGFFIRAIYPFRKIISKKTVLTNRIAAVLCMEEIRRSF